MKTILATILVIISALVFFIIINKEKVDVPAPIIDQNNQPEPEPPKEIIDLSQVEKPASFANVPMTTYKSAEYGYEITYPEGWVSILTPKEVTDGPDLEDYAIYPKDIPYGPSSIFNITYYQYEVNSFINRKSEIYDITKISLNDLNGYKYTSGTEKNHTKISFIFTVDDEHILTIIYWPNEAYDTTEEEAMWVLSTLKLTDD